MNYKKLGDYITQRREKNTTINLPICGVCREGLIPQNNKMQIYLFTMYFIKMILFLILHEWS